MAKWIDFTEIGTPPNRKTRIWLVVARDGGDRLGEISWYSRWRQYAFFPLSDTVYEHQCLRDLSDFCEQQTQAHRAAKKKLDNEPAL